MPGNPAGHEGGASAWVVVLEDGKTVFFSAAARAEEFAHAYQMARGVKPTVLERKESK